MTETEEHLYHVYISLIAGSYIVKATSPEHAIYRLRNWDYFCPTTLSDIADDEFEIRPIPETPFLI